jgi:hypothetical protein
MAIGDAAVLNPASDQCQEVFVMRHKDSLFRDCEFQLTLVGCPEQSGFVRARNVGPAPPQTLGHCRIDAFVEMEAQRSHHASAESTASLARSFDG